MIFSGSRVKIVSPRLRPVKQKTLMRRSCWAGASNRFQSVEVSKRKPQISSRSIIWHLGVKEYKKHVSIFRNVLKSNPLALNYKSMKKINTHQAMLDMDRPGVGALFRFWLLPVMRKVLGSRSASYQQSDRAKQQCPRRVRQIQGKLAYDFGVINVDSMYFFPFWMYIVYHIFCRPFSPGRFLPERAGNTEFMMDWNGLNHLVVDEPEESTHLSSTTLV